jgi:hypothetical protein
MRPITGLFLPLGGYDNLTLSAEVRIDRHGSCGMEISLWVERFWLHGWKRCVTDLCSSAARNGGMEHDTLRRIAGAAGLDKGFPLGAYRQVCVNSRSLPQGSRARARQTGAAAPGSWMGAVAADAARGWCYDGRNSGQPQGQPQGRLMVGRESSTHCPDPRPLGAPHEAADSSTKPGFSWRAMGGERKKS